MQICKKIADARWFGHFIIGVILSAGVLVGIQTYKNFAVQHHGLLHFLDHLILWIFAVEAVIKILAEGKRPWKYFMDPWNLFDFTIVAVCFLPFDASFVAVLRLARILRVFRLVTALPKLQILVGALLKSIPSMGYVGILLFILFYIYACLAVSFYGANDPVHFGNLQTSMLSLFRVVTLEDWTDIMYINMYGCAKYSSYPEGLCTNSYGSFWGASIFFVSFVLIGTMIVLNLFIGVIMNSMQEMRAETEMEDIVQKRRDNKTSIRDEIHLIARKVDEIKKELEILRHKTET